MERCITEADQGDKIAVTVSLPVRGEYGLEVYGNDPAKDGDTYTHVCQYFVHYASPDEQSNAFYQETPNRQRNVPGGQATMQKGYNPDTQQVRHYSCYPSCCIVCHCKNISVSDAEK